METPVGEQMTMVDEAEESRLSKTDWVLLQPHDESSKSVAERARAAGYENTTANHVSSIRWQAKHDGRGPRDDAERPRVGVRRLQKGTTSELIRNYPLDIKATEVVKLVRKTRPLGWKKVTAKMVMTTRWRDKQQGYEHLYAKSVPASAPSETRTEIVRAPAKAPRAQVDSAVPVVRWTETEKQFARIAVSIGVQQAAAILQHVQSHMVKSLDGLFGKE